MSPPHYKYDKTFLVATHGSMGIGGSIWASWKVLGLAYNRCENRDQQPLGKDLDRNWCHHHTPVELSCYWFFHRLSYVFYCLDSEEECPSLCSGPIVSYLLSGIINEWLTIQILFKAITSSDMHLPCKKYLFSLQFIKFNYFCVNISVNYTFFAYLHLNETIKYKYFGRW